MWDLPGPGLEPVCPALAGRFLTTVPPGKPQSVFSARFLLSRRDLGDLEPLQRSLVNEPQAGFFGGLGTPFVRGLALVKQMQSMSNAPGKDLSHSG